MSPEQIAGIDEFLASWREGDVVVGSFPFIHLANLDVPSTPSAEQQAADDSEGGLAVISVDMDGLVVVSQTCDIVRSCRVRPFLEVCPLVSIPAKDVEALRLGRLSRYMALPALSDATSAADLERVMTVEKAVLFAMTANRRPGVASEDEARVLSDTLARKRSRAAFPNDFTAAVEKMRKRIVYKCKSGTAEGAFLRGLNQIRVRARPDWSADEIEVEFLFVFDAKAAIPNDADDWIAKLLGRVTISERLSDVSSRAVGLDELSAKTYLESDRLDLDHLSSGS